RLQGDWSSDVCSSDLIPELIDEALRAAVSAPSGPAFVDLPLDHVFGEAPDPGPPDALPDPTEGPAPSGGAFERAAALLRDAERQIGRASCRERGESSV